MRFSRLAAVAGASVLVLGIASCSSTGGKPQESGGGMGAGQANTPRVTVAMITHEVPGDSFWDLIRKGAQAAADKDNIELRYSNDPEAPNQANLVQSAIDSGVKGIALTLAKPDAMAPAVKAALDKNIPVVAFNSGFDNWKAMGVQEYFGQDEKLAGVAAGERLNQDGAKKVICVIQEQGQVALESRCAGVKEGFKGQSEILNVNSKDMPSVESTITAKLQQDKSVDHVVALGAPIALAAVQSVGNAASSAQVVTFDTNAALVDAIKKGDVKWAVDQQPFLQGYLAIDSLWLFINNQNLIGGGQATLTGPSFIDQSNIDAVADLAKVRNQIRRAGESNHDYTNRFGRCQSQELSATNESKNETGCSAFLFVPRWVRRSARSRSSSSSWFVAPPFRSPEALATVLYASSTIGIMACAVALLMIGGEFDLSSGVAVTTSSLAASMLAYNLHLNLWAGAGLALIVALAVGFFNGYLVMKTKIPSFLITLGTLLMLTGINLAATKLISGQVATPSVNDMQGWASAQKVFSSSFTDRRCRASVSPCCGGCCSPLLRPMCCSRPASATGSSP